MPKTAWPHHLAEVINNTPFNLKDSWQNIKKLCGGEKSHHFFPKITQMKLLSGNLSEKNEENVSVFTSHFSKALTDKKQRTTTLSRRSTYVNLRWSLMIHRLGRNSHCFNPVIWDVSHFKFRNMTDQRLANL